MEVSACRELDQPPPLVHFWLQPWNGTNVIVCLQEEGGEVAVGSGECDSDDDKDWDKVPDEIPDLKACECGGF